MFKFVIFTYLLSQFLNTMSSYSLCEKIKLEICLVMDEKDSLKSHFFLYFAYMVPKILIPIDSYKFN